MSENIDTTGGQTFNTPEEAIVFYEETINLNRLAEQLENVSIAESDARMEVVAEIRKLLRGYTVSVQGADGMPADVMLCYGRETNVRESDYEQWGKEFGSRLVRFNPRKFLDTVASIADKPDAQFTEAFREVLANTTMPKVVADQIERIFGVV